MGKHSKNFTLDDIVTTLSFLESFFDDGLVDMIAGYSRHLFGNY